jgi:diguanylate cyclase (GGDEF)-like protein/PAS domain S-box-containing protein
MENLSKWKTYVIYISLTLSVIYPIAILQWFLFDISFDVLYLVAPTLASLIVGILLSNTVILKTSLKRKSEQFRAIADLAQEFTYLRDVDGTYTYVSPYCLELTGYSQEEFYQNKNLMDKLIYPPDQNLWNDHVHQINTKGCMETIDLRIVSKSGETKWLNHICMTVHDAIEEKDVIRSTNLDITARKQAEKKIHQLAHIDELTELGNRRLLRKDLREAIRKKTDDNTSFAVFFLDLDRFKNINDSFGHNFGDRLLRQIASRLKRPTAENTTTYRYGGDEFVIISSNELTESEAKEVANKVLSDIEQPIKIEGIELFMSACIGISLFPNNGSDFDSLIRNADVAMHKTKGLEASKVEVYNSHEHKKSSRLILTETLIHKGIKNQEFDVHYQPQVDMHTGKLIGVEALARWPHPTEGMISPLEFIGVAEESGQMIKLGRQLLAKTISDLKQWTNKGIQLPVAINVSARQFSDINFQEHLLTSLAAEAIPCSLVHIEVTEQVFLGDLETASSRLNSLKKQGFSISLDDFGTGYSSFSYLKKLPVDKLKIDRSFILNITKSKVEREIIKALTSMCRELGIEVIVEGVESEQQANILCDVGCEIAQGFYYYKPVRCSELMSLSKIKKQFENYRS